MNIENEPIKVDRPRGVDPEKWLEYKKHRVNATVTLGFFALVAVTVILLAWSPWN